MKLSLSRDFPNSIHKIIMIVVSMMFFLSVVFRYKQIPYNTFFTSLIFAVLLSVVIFLKLRIPNPVLIVCAVIGLIVRIYWSGFSGSPLTSDHAFYYWMAERIQEGQFLVHPFKQTGTSILTLLWFFISGLKNKEIAMAPLGFLSWFEIVLVFSIFKKRNLRDQGAVVFLILMFWPEHILTSNMLAAANYQRFFLVLSWWLLEMLDQCSPKLEWVLAITLGFTLGAVQWIRGTGLILLIVFVFVAVMRKYNRSKILLAILGFSLLVSPIGYFNFKNLSVVGISPAQNSGVSMAIGFNLETRGHYYENFNDDIVKRMFRNIEDKGSAELLEKALSKDFSMEKILYEHKTVMDFAILRNKAAMDLAMERFSNNKLESIVNMISYKMPIYLTESTSLSWSMTDTVLQKNEPVIQEIDDSVILGFCILIGFSIWFSFWSQDFTSLEVIPLFVTSALCLVHMLAEIQSQYHLAHLIFYPVLAVILMSRVFDSVRNSHLSFLGFRLNR